MKRIKPIIISCMFAVTLTLSYPVTREADNAKAEQCHITVADIVIKVKYVKGIKYVRRWNQANNTWVDDEWKRVD